jgi:hypothetical protein
MAAYKRAVTAHYLKFQESLGKRSKPSIYAAFSKKNLNGTEWNVDVFRFFFASPKRKTPKEELRIGKGKWKEVLSPNSKQILF